MVRLMTSLVTNSILYSYPNFFQKKPMPATMKTGAQTSRTDRNKLKRYTDSESHSYNNMSLSTYHIKKKLMPEKRKASSLGNCLLNKQKFIISVKRPNVRPILISMLQFLDSFKL